ncbi:hypothetical protein AYI70_g3047 [Smittium culicis]|uniref:Uncharacterized protein n=1 Tax=Smittium culicis TaxID=133412 RepID=A0A1R1Y5C9_9FUNG|nr:hypothetical protein AYI70_g3047 [Smittium culicis]
MIQQSQIQEPQQLEASPDPDSKGQTEVLSRGMEEAYRSPIGITGDQERVPNSLQYASSHGQLAKDGREGLIVTSGKDHREGYYKPLFQKKL